VVCAGTSDLPVAEEAAVTADIMGNQVERIYDVGVAGLHRLLNKLELIQKARVVIVVAGMEGALPSVVAGLVSRPVIAVPTSVGYGANFAGLTPLLSMLNSCSSGVTVVNIDNGFGAGYAASQINALGRTRPETAFASENTLSGYFQRPERRYVYRRDARSWPGPGSPGAGIGQVERGRIPFARLARQTLPDRRDEV
jgi:phosphoribosylcarboxyaminoimidazole (NCAIR) mutase